jgi:type IV pilus assembly protein PilV
MSARPSNARRQLGVSLIEVLIALVVLSIGLIGIAGMQTTGLQSNYTSYQYTQAAMLAESLAEGAAANTTGVQNSAYDLGAGSAPGSVSSDCGSETCSSAQQAAWDLAGWYSALGQTAVQGAPAGPRATLPAGAGSVVCADDPCSDDSPRVITVYWSANRDGASGYGCDASNPADLQCFRVVFIP